MKQEASKHKVIVQLNTQILSIQCQIKNQKAITNHFNWHNFECVQFEDQYHRLCVSFFQWLP